MTPDFKKVRSENIRWQILLTLDNSRPVPAYESVILTVIRATYPDATEMEVRRELDYLDDRKLVKVEKRPDGRWLTDLTRYGVDIVEYTIDCLPGIARPEKYW